MATVVKSPAKIECTEKEKVELTENQKETLKSIFEAYVKQSKTQIRKENKGNLGGLLARLRELREEAQSSLGSWSCKDRVQWFHKVLKTLAELKIVSTFVKVVTDEAPRFWSLLSLKQRIQLLAFLPVIAAGFTIGNIGIAGGGTAIGVSGSVVMVALLLMSGGVIDFMDTLISALEKLSHEELPADSSQGEVAVVPESIPEPVSSTSTAEESSQLRRTDQRRSREEEVRRALGYIGERFQGDNTFFSVTTSQGTGCDGWVIGECEMALVGFYEAERAPLTAQDCINYYEVLKRWQQDGVTQSPLLPLKTFYLVGVQEWSEEAKNLALSVGGGSELVLVTLPLTQEFPPDDLTIFATTDQGSDFNDQTDEELVRHSEHLVSVQGFA